MRTYRWSGALVVATATLLSGAVTVSVVAAAGETAGERPLPEVAGYRQWTRVTPKPLLLTSQMTYLCMAAPPGRAPLPNPHRDRYFRVYVSRAGEKSMRDTTSHFPVGSTIVKEKLRSKHGGTPELLTVMVKRQTGFDPPNGDWEYFATDASGKVSKPREVKHCQSCHSRVRKSDYVFRSYLMEPRKRPIF